MDAETFPRINRVIISGFLQQDPELRHTPSGVAVASFRVRCGRWVRDRRGALRETVSFFTVVVWQDVAERICREGKNGQAIYVEGYLHSRSFTAASGDRRTAVEIYAELAELADSRLESGPERRGNGPRGGRRGHRDEPEGAENPEHRDEDHPESEQPVPEGDDKQDES